MSHEPCPRCRARGQTWPGDPPRCAFQKYGGEVPVFDTENWNCATMNALRNLTGGRFDQVCSEDQYTAILPNEGSFIILSWYKNRGRTEGAWELSSEHSEALTLATAEQVLSRQLDR